MVLLYKIISLVKIIYLHFHSYCITLLMDCRSSNGFHLHGKADCSCLCNQFGCVCWCLGVVYNRSQPKWNPGRQERHIQMEREAFIHPSQEYCRNPEGRICECVRAKRSTTRQRACPDVRVVGCHWSVHPLRLCAYRQCRWVETFKNLLFPDSWITWVNFLLLI